MSEERSVKIHLKAEEAAEKLDYFLCGVAGALFAYVGQNYIPQPLGWNLTLFEPVALTLLVGSFVASLKRIETVIVAKRCNAAMLHAGEIADQCTKLMMAGNGVIHGEGDVITVQTAPTARAKLQYIADEKRKQTEHLSVKSLRLYQIRNGLLIGGFLALLAAKILKPYAKVFGQ